MDYHHSLAGWLLATCNLWQQLIRQIARLRLDWFAAMAITNGQRRRKSIYTRRSFCKPEKPENWAGLPGGQRSLSWEYKIMKMCHNGTARTSSSELNGANCWPATCVKQMSTVNKPGPKSSPTRDSTNWQAIKKRRRRSRPVKQWPVANYKCFGHYAMHWEERSTT